MPSVLRTSPLLGYDEQLHAIFSPDPAGTVRPRTRSGTDCPRTRSRAPVSPNQTPRSLSRGRPVSSRTRPRKFATSSDPYIEPDTNPCLSAPSIDFSNLSPALQLAPFDKTSISAINRDLIPPRPPSSAENCSDQFKRLTPTSREFDKPVSNNQCDDDNSSTKTLVLEIIYTGDNEDEFQLYPEAEDIMAFI